MANAKGLFVLGTDTGVGKTMIATTLLRSWAAVGRRVSGFKPCETGGGDDGAQLGAATGRGIDPEAVSPYRFELAAAPFIAAAQSGVELDFSVLDRHLTTLAADSEVVIIEGAGGLLVPWTATTTTAELVSHVGLPVLLVARTSLGTINHTLLTLEALERRSIPVLGVVFSQTTPKAGPEEHLTVRYLRERVNCLGVVPWLEASSLEARQRECASHFDVEELWRRVSV